tara:strand:- start:430 stop:801 length:372 start_codon:yes stop_codon:yes gene_type:complete
METYIILALVLALLQIWIIPMMLNLKNMNYLISNRDEVIDDSDSVLLLRSRRAYANLQESLPAFLALALLSMIMGVDATNAACWWLIFRVLHGVCYLVGITYLRTLAWFGALGSLVAMALKLL